MDQRINDLRILHLALGVEDSLEKMQQGFTKHLSDPIALQAAKATQEEGSAHKRLRQAYQKLNHDIALDGIQPSDLQLIEALFEGEKHARLFYDEWSDRLFDPALKALFEAMREAEQGHVELIGAQLARLNANVMPD